MIYSTEAESTLTLNSLELQLQSQKGIDRDEILQYRGTVWKLKKIYIYIYIPTVLSTRRVGWTHNPGSLSSLCPLPD